MSPKSGSGGSGQMRMRGQDHSLTEVLSHLQPPEHTPAQGLRRLRSTGLKEGEGLTFSPLALSRHSLAISGEMATPGKGGCLWPCPGWPFSRPEELRGLLLVVGCATVALVAQALLSSRGLPSEDNMVPYVLPWPRSPSGVSCKFPSPWPERPFGQG